MNKKLLAVCTWAVIFLAIRMAAQETNGIESAGITNYPFKQISDSEGIWTARGIGQGFRADAQEFGVSLGNALETRDIGGKRHHDLLLGRAYYGHMLGNLVGADKWYGGNFEIMQEVFGGWQYYKGSRYLAGTTTIVRYNFATGTRWEPFLDAGPGAALTNIGHPDLGSLGEFDAQIGAGINYFLRRNVALTLQYRYLHISNAGIVPPNQGINENICYLGVSWFF